VREIRSLRASGALIAGLSIQFGVSESQISNVVHMRHWKEAS